MNLLYRAIMLICALVFGLGTLSAQSQYTIQGKVVDSKGKPIPGALVKSSLSYPGAICATSTGVDGEFVLTSFQPIDRVIVEYAGYERKGKKTSDNMIVKLPKAYDNTWSLTFQMSFPDASHMTPSMGGMLSWCRLLGFYMRGVGNAISDFRYNDTYNLDPERFSHTGNRKASYVSITGGIMGRPYEYVNVYLGMGYAYRDVAYEVSDPYSMSYETNYYLHPTHSYSTVVVDMGLVIKLRPFALTAGLTIVPNVGCVGNFGAGFCF